jgi:hypothetical protein
MHELETEARPHLTPMIQGRARYLHKRSQASVAAWATKTALALHLTTPEKGAPQAHYREMATTHRAPRQTQVWLAAYQGQHAAHHHSSLLELTTHARSANGYGTTLAVGRLVVQVFGYVGIEEGVTVTKRGAAEQATLEIHPFEHSLIWPPHLILDDASLRSFAATFETPT